VQQIAAPADLLGVNYYAPTVVRLRTDGADAGVPNAAQWVACEPVEWVGIPGGHTAMGWPIDATGLDELLLRLHRDYPGTPLMVTENGAAFDDVLDEEAGRVHDQRRVAYLHDHLEAVGRALAAGGPLGGWPEL
jgi:beta-glucosidase